MFRHQLGPGAELSLFELGHAAALFAQVEANRARLRTYLPWVDDTRAVGDVQAFIRKASAQWAEGLGFHAGIWSEARLAGAIGMHPIHRGNKSCSLGYWIGQEFEGRGLVTAACRAVVDYCFRDCGLHRVEIHCATTNTRSCAIPERLGFHLEGVLRQAQWAGGNWLDIRVYGKLADEHG